MSIISIGACISNQDIKLIACAIREYVLINKYKITLPKQRHLLTLGEQ